MSHKKYLLFISLLPAAFNISAQGAEHIQARQLSLSAYINLAKENNLSVDNKRLALDSSIANKDPMSARVINPTLTYSRGSYNAQTPYVPYASPPANTLALSGIIEGWGKRAARKSLAESEIQKNEAELSASSHALELEASFAYFDALRPKLSIKAYQQALEKSQSLNLPNTNPELAEFNQKKQREMKNYRYFSLSMQTLIPKSPDLAVEPIGEGECKPLQLQTQQLLSHALSNRSDLSAMDQTLKTADSQVTLTKNNRNIDIRPSVWTSRTPSYADGGTQNGASTSMGFSIQVPIPIQLMYDADIVNANNNRQRVENNLQNLKHQIRIDIEQSVMQYETALNTYQEKQEIYKDTIKKYQANTLKNIQVILSAQLAMIDSRINHSKALVYLMNKSGNYDVSLYCQN